MESYTSTTTTITTSLPEVSEGFRSVFGSNVTRQQQVIYAILLSVVVFCMLVVVAMVTVRRCTRRHRKHQYDTPKAKPESNLYEPVDTGTAIKKPAHKSTHTEEDVQYVEESCDEDHNHANNGNPSTYNSLASNTMGTRGTLVATERQDNDIYVGVLQNAEEGNDYPQNDTNAGTSTLQVQANEAIEESASLSKYSI